MKNIFEKISPNKKEEYQPPRTNRHFGARETLEEFEDEYTKKKRQEDFLKEYHGVPEGLFINKSDKAVPLSQLNGESEDLLANARDSIAAEIANNARLAELSEDQEEETTAAALKNETKVKRTKNWFQAPSSIVSFHEKAHAHQKKKKLGLYKYNPKLNAGAPENIKERRRQTRQAQEKNDQI